MLTNPYVDPRCSHTTAHGHRCRMLAANEKTSLCQLHLASLSAMERQNLRAETAPAIKQILARILKSPILDAAAPSPDCNEGASASSQPQEPASQDTQSVPNITIANY